MARKYSDDRYPKSRKDKSSSKLKKLRSSQEDNPSSIVHTEVFGEKNNHFLTNKLLEYTNDM